MAGRRAVRTGGLGQQARVGRAHGCQASGSSPDGHSIRGASSKHANVCRVADFDRPETSADPAIASARSNRGCCAGPGRVSSG